jgi:hypothetical protein
MKNILLILVLLFLSTSIYATENNYEAIEDAGLIKFDNLNDSWQIANNFEGEFVFKKRLYEGAGSYSQYFSTDDKIAFTLTSDYELIKDNKLIAIDNEELKFNEIVYNGETFDEIPLTIEEIQDIFPEAEIINLSSIDSDNKMWIHKPLFKNKQILFVNDSSSNSFYKLTANCKKAQDENIKSLITISRYGIYRFKHYGQRNGKLIIYVR